MIYIDDFELAFCNVIYITVLLNYINRTLSLNHYNYIIVII